MTTGSILEVAIAVVLIVAGIVSYRRGGNQGAVILFVVAALLLVHGLDLLQYRPSATEIRQ